MSFALRLEVSNRRFLGESGNERNISEHGLNSMIDLLVGQLLLKLLCVGVVLGLKVAKLLGQFIIALRFFLKFFDVLVAAGDLILVSVALSSERLDRFLVRGDGSPEFGEIVSVLVENGIDLLFGDSGNLLLQEISFHGYSFRLRHLLRGGTALSSAGSFTSANTKDNHSCKTYDADESAAGTLAALLLGGTLCHSAHLLSILEYIGIGNSINLLIRAMDAIATLYNLAPAGDYEVSCKWDDSVVTDADTERMRDLQEIRDGIMQKWEYRVKWYGEDAETAKRMAQSADESDDEIMGFSNGVPNLDNKKKGDVER